MNDVSQSSAPGKPEPASMHRPPADLTAALRGVKRPIVFGHVVPDADCLGAALGLAASLRAGGIDARVGLPAGSVSKRLRFMLDLVPEVPIASSLPDDRDAVIMMDTASEARIHFDPRPSPADFQSSINIDHHVTNSRFARVNWVDEAASSTCEMVATLIRTEGWPLSAGVASLLFAGIHGDTGGFSLPGTSADALHCAADLVRAGADVSFIGERMCRSQESSEFDLLRRVYDHTTTVAGGRIAYSRLSYDDIVDAGCGPADIDDQVLIPRSLRGVRIALLFSEGEPGVTRVNLRGEGDVSVLEIAGQFGGGGHRQSAGIRIKSKPLDQVIEDVVRAAESHLDALEAAAASP